MVGMAVHLSMDTAVLVATDGKPTFLKPYPGTGIGHQAIFDMFGTDIQIWEHPVSDKHVFIVSGRPPSLSSTSENSEREWTVSILRPRTNAVFAGFVGKVLVCPLALLDASKLGDAFMSDSSASGGAVSVAAR